MRRRILVLFPDEWDRVAAADARFRDRFDFSFEGFDLFRFPENARLFTFDALAFVEGICRRYANARLDAVVTSDEQFGPFIAALVCERLGLPHTPVRAILEIQHKFYARRAFARIVPEANPEFALLRRDYAEPGDVPLPFPFYVKPAKAAFSVLARRVDSFEELRRHTRFGWLERAIIERLVRPFEQVMRAYSGFEEHPFSMVCEGLLPGRQVTVNGFARDGEVTMLGVVDSIMYPGTDQFQRFQYPSTLTHQEQARAEAIATKLVRGIGFRHGMFNIEMRLDPADGRPRLIEMNPRAAGQFYDLFERVDGYNLFDALLDLESGREPVIRRREGRDRHAASFVLRDLSGAGLSRWPSGAEIAALREANRDGHLMLYPKRGADLRREMKWLGSYRYGVFNVGAATVEELFARFRRLCRQIGFHPVGHPLAAEDLHIAIAGD